uniref:Uncharacterized protein n=1 Tax=Physcomitrium patens TaxID=3218 RepID=A0A2K1IVD0_PHYPA|nr:hypothetical protein PHYPA_025174 [Physcomitrium patens]
MPSVVLRLPLRKETFCNAEKTQTILNQRAHASHVHQTPHSNSKNCPEELKSRKNTHLSAFASNFHLFSLEI